MMKFTVLYPSSEGSNFDYDYYRSSHVPMANERLRATRFELERGVSGGTSAAPAPFHAGVHFYFGTFEELQAALASSGSELAADIPNYTNVTPVIQISEIDP